jgi:hypothetical protein
MEKTLTHVVFSTSHGIYQIQIMFIVLNDQYIILEENTINAWCKERVLGYPEYQTLSLMIIYYNNLLTVLCDVHVWATQHKKETGSVFGCTYLFRVLVCSTNKIYIQSKNEIFKQNITVNCHLLIRKKNVLLWTIGNSFHVHVPIKERMMY